MRGCAHFHRLWKSRKWPETSDNSTRFRYRPRNSPVAGLCSAKRFGLQPMRFTPQFLDELKARLPVSEVVGRRVKLVRAGREFKGLSPFNKEKTPSFFVNDQKQAWFDFSSGKNGSIFDFVMQSEGVTFPEAVERLAQMAGVPLPQVSHADQARVWTPHTR